VADELRIGLQELLRKAQVGGDANFLKEGVRALSQAIMEMEVEDHIGAARHERGPGRTGQRNGYRQRLPPKATAKGYRQRLPPKATAKGCGTRGSGPWNWMFLG
jgi:transposase-like protein